MIEFNRDELLVLSEAMEEFLNTASEKGFDNMEMYLLHSKLLSELGMSQYEEVV